MLRRTHMGLNVRAAGDAPGALDAAGVSVFATRSFAVLFAGAMAGLGGAFLSIVSAGLFQDTVVGGRGFIAIVLAMLARGRPFWAVAGALLFGASLAIADWAQVANFYFGLPSSTFTDTVFMLPFVLVLIVLVLFGRRAYLPAALALPYERGTR
jgi:simple sugar transport system permease protein